MERPLFFASKILGALPFNIYQHKTTCIDYILVIVIPIIYAICYAGVTIYFDVIPKKVDCNICSIVEKFYLYTGIWAYFFIAIRVATKKDFLIKFQRTIMEIDDELKNCTDGNLKVPRKSRFQVVFLGVGCFLFLIGMVYDTYYVVGLTGTVFILSSFCATFPFTVACLSQGQFTALVHEIALRFDDLNNVLETITEEADTRCGRLKIFDIENELIEKSGSKKKEVAEEQKSKRRDPERFLVDVFKLHDKLCAVSVLINGEYAVEVVCYMTATFIINVFGIFLETKVIFIVGGKNRYFDFLATSYVLWGIIFLLAAYMVLRLCCRVMREAKRSALLVHEIMQKKPAFMLGNDVYYNRMKGFTLQYLHWESYFCFNGIGLFPLDYTFIFSAISAATSYLIVLLQFDLNNVM